MQYINYVSIESVEAMDSFPGDGPIQCSIATNTCYNLHHGGRLYISNPGTFTTTDTTSGLYFYFDPDGTYSGSPTGNGKAVMFFIYYNGKIRTWSTLEPGSMCGLGGCTPGLNPTPAIEAPWFSWSN